MDNNNLLDELHALQYTACVNQRYHQAQERRYGFWERTIRISVGVLSVISLLCCFLPGDKYLVGVAVSSIGLAAAIALNVAPVGDLEKKYRELFRRWTDLRTEVEDLQVVSQRDSGRALGERIDRLRELLSKRHSIEADEPAPDQGVLNRVQQELNQSTYGTTDYEEICKFVERRNEEKARAEKLRRGDATPPPEAAPAA